MSEHFHVAIDLGAESGRVIVGRVAKGRIELEEILRFPTGILARGRGLFWKLQEMEDFVIKGLSEVGKRHLPIASISADSWGIDYVLLDTEGRPLVEPRCYRDPRNLESVPRVLRKIAAADLYAETGVPPVAINTLFQLEAESWENPGLLKRAHRLLMIADYLNFRISGVDVAEASLASTSQLYNPRLGTWSKKIIDCIALSESLLPRIVSGGTRLGVSVGSVRAIPGMDAAQVIASCSHDTAAAIAAIPAETQRNWAYLSSGTWSIMGAEITEPLSSAQALDAGFIHEVGLEGTLLLAKNIVGLWIVQECARYWREQGQVFNYDDLTRMAVTEAASAAYINVEDRRFLSPGEMPRKIATFCRETGQDAPQTPAQFTRLVLESLALFYARTLRQLEQVTERRYDVLHLVGGGSRNHLLNQLTASAAEVQVVAGPIEATAAGNILIQAKALGLIKSAREMRAITANSFPIHRYQAGSHFSDQSRARFARLFQ